MVSCSKSERFWSKCCDDVDDVAEADNEGAGNGKGGKITDFVKAKMRKEKESNRRNRMKRRRRGMA